MKVNLGHKQLIISLKNKPGRPRQTFARQARFFMAFLGRIWSDNRFTGNRISRVFRRVFEVGRIKQLVGLNLAMVGIVSGAQFPALAVQQVESPLIENQPLSITTTKAVQAPVQPVVVSQKFHQFHPGLDLKAPSGTPISPVMAGQVEVVIFGHYGYGNYIIIDHHNGYESLYAHLSKVLVREGENVSHQTILGAVGSTGWSTGPHLHLEIWKFKQPINPIFVIE